ncbi:MazG-like family protein [Mammaliicoccus sp. Dog046]|uniref:MazG-like family protein n=1 Tax=Mammaliicoccus sp. Dog046 TaxID=3034233 RepID=UPI002B25D73B|nr:MazG-like family protein [Mammaliicoccus sp. Dog046]WQK84934.1 MazG-like family protein [Mammaliicoccus sp. Dog046]
MNINEFQLWTKQFYKQRGWYELDVFKRLAFLTEETGEVARAIRAIEIGRDRPDESILNNEDKITELKSELGDVFANLTIIVDKYDLNIEDILKEHCDKLDQRFN